jgi:hypothetical protein
MYSTETFNFAQKNYILQGKLHFFSITLFDALLRKHLVGLNFPYIQENNNKKAIHGGLICNHRYVVVYSYALKTILVYLNILVEI